MNEREYKEKGEELAKLAVSVRFPISQLRGFHSDLKTKPIPMVEARVQYQIGRAYSGGRGRLTGYNMVGPRFLELIEEHEADKAGLQKIVEYAIRTFGYYDLKNKSKLGDSTDVKSGFKAPTSSLGSNLEKQLEELVKNHCQRFGYGGIKVSSNRRGYVVNVSLRRFRGNPAELGRELYGEAVRKFPELSNRVRFWIDRR
ncbi:MAG: hypothetical protein ACTSYO_00275 [Candidatus Ranarchaeia archaeon]